MDKPDMNSRDVAALSIGFFIGCTLAWGCFSAFISQWGYFPCALSWLGWCLCTTWFDAEKKKEGE